MCITWELVVYAAVSEVTADAMGVAVDDGISILIISFSTIFLLGGSFGFRRCGLFTLFLMLNFCAVYFSIISFNLDLRSLYSEALFTGCTFTVIMFVIYSCCDANALLSCRMALEASSVTLTETVV